MKINCNTEGCHGTVSVEGDVVQLPGVRRWAASLVLFIVIYIGTSWIDYLFIAGGVVASILGLAGVVTLMCTAANGAVRAATMYQVVHAKNLLLSSAVFYAVAFVLHLGGGALLTTEYFAEETYRLRVALWPPSLVSCVLCTLCSSFLCARLRLYIHQAKLLGVEGEEVCVWVGNAQDRGEVVRSAEIMTAQEIKDGGI